MKFGDPVFVNYIKLLSRSPKTKEGGKLLFSSFSIECGWRESNSHRLTPTTPSKWRVYHFTTSAFDLGLQR